MNWKFWEKSGAENSAKVKKLNKPKELPEAVGRKLVVGLQIDPDEAWSLRYVGRPSETKPGIQDFRLFNPEHAHLARLTVKDWTSLDDHQELILYEGQFDRSTKLVELWPKSKSAA
jgi:hypothetical protein